MGFLLQHIDNYNDQIDVLGVCELVFGFTVSLCFVVRLIDPC